MHTSFALVLVATAVTATGCQATSMCGPPGARVSGQMVLAESSPAYQSQVAAQNGAGAPHVACRAEATITMVLTGATDPAKTDPSLASGGYSQRTDPHLHAGSQTAVSQQGQYRVLGVGRGTDRDDCGKAAMHACNDAVDEYFRRAQAVRTSDAVCQLSDSQEYCAAAAK